MNKLISFLFALLCATTTTWAQDSGYPELDAMVPVWKNAQETTFGYPASQKSLLAKFYEWYLASGMDVVNLNNAGDPMTDEPSTLSTQMFERQVIEFFAPLYDFRLDDVWGLVTHSGTDGNNHGIYFGVNYLRNQTQLEPVLYVSDEAHYSNMRLAHLQNLDMRLVASDSMGRMIPDSLEKVLVTSRPALMVYAMGSTFKGAIDDQKALNAVLDAHPEIPGVYRHVDAALFGGYLPFTPYRALVSRDSMHYESIAVSGHKFFGIDSPCGLFICTREVYDKQVSYNVPYLNSNMRMINCSRDALDPLKFWWLIKYHGFEGWEYQAAQVLSQRDYLKHQLDSIGWPCWVNEYSNTVFFRRPSQRVISKYTLAQGHDDRFGGDLAHVVVMQHVSKEKIDMFINDLTEEQTVSVTWDSIFVDKVRAWRDGDGNIEHTNNTKDGITVTYDGPGKYCGFAYGEIYFYKADAKQTFTSTVGSISRIEISGVQVRTIYPEGWKWIPEEQVDVSHYRGKLIWEGTPADSVSMNGSDEPIDIKDISQIVFTVSGKPTAINEVKQGQNPNRKLIKDGQLIIKANGKTYNAAGVPVDTKR